MDFDCSDEHHLDVHSKNINGVGVMGFKTFSVEVFLTLTFDSTNHLIDVMSWVPEITTLQGFTFHPLSVNPPLFTVAGTFLGRPVPDNLVVSGPDQLRDFLKREVIKITLDLRDDSVVKDQFVDELYSRIYGMITDDKPFEQPTVRDQLNAMINSWLMGGVINHPKVGGSSIPKMSVW